MEGSAPVKRTAFVGPCYLKVLVNNYVAGAVIGKSGAVIAQLEQDSGCALKLSPAQMYYPGTQERILVMSGDQESLNNVLYAIIDKINEVQVQYAATAEGGAAAAAAAAADPYDGPQSQKVGIKIVVPKTGVSAIIGKGGQQIKDLQETTNARVQVSNREEGMAERLVTVSGNINHVKAAALAVSACIQNDPALKEHMNVVYSKGTAPNTAMGMSPFNYVGYPQQAGYANAGGGVTPYGGGPNVLDQHCEIAIQVAEPLIGAVIGRNGQYVTDTMKQTRARVRISPKGEFVPGTTDRKIGISGSVGAVHAAHILLLQRVQSAQNSQQAAAAANGMHCNGMGNGVDMQQQQQVGGMMLQGGVQYMPTAGYQY